jgi:cytidyltransferase-like protein
MSPPPTLRTARQRSSGTEPGSAVGAALRPHQVLFLRAKKAVHDVGRELELLAEYLRLNDVGVYKIAKKWDKQTGSRAKDAYLAALHAPGARHAYLAGGEVSELARRCAAILAGVKSVEPQHKAWARTKVYTIGCFDLMHHGHSNLLVAMKQFGATLVVGIHDDESYLRLKGQLPIDSLDKRIAKLRPFADQVFVIPACDPTPYIQVRPDIWSETRSPTNPRG